MSRQICYSSSHEFQSNSIGGVRLSQPPLNRLLIMEKVISPFARVAFRRFDFPGTVDQQSGFFNMA